MIPKIIHYCWFGRNSKPELAMRCIESWKKYCHDYDFIEWNEDNFDLSYNDYVREAYENKKWAFVTDVVRLYALVHHGGIYMDTDVEVLQPLDSLLKYSAVSGFESEKQIPTGLMACEKGNRMFKEFLDDYQGVHFIRSDGTLDLTTNVTRITKSCMKYGLIQNNSLQTINSFTLLPKDYLCPKDLETKQVHLTENSLVIHHFDGSWHTEEDEYAYNLRKEFEKRYKFIPEAFIRYCVKILTVAKYHGFLHVLRLSMSWAKRKLAQ